VLCIDLVSARHGGVREAHLMLLHDKADDKPGEQERRGIIAVF
jgi:hypothetical protein